MIVQAACSVFVPSMKDLQIIPLHRHGDIGKIFKSFGYNPCDCKIVEQGFIDNNGNFYTRKEAAKYMRDHLQKTRLGDYPVEELYSEDLY